MSIERLLIAYDGSSAADAAIEGLSEAGLPAELAVTVLSVADVYLPAEGVGAEPPGVPSSVVRRAREKALHEVEKSRALAERATALVRQKFPGWECRPMALGDSPGWAVIAQAGELKADLVIAGAQSHSRLERMFLGSVSHKVAAEAPCSVRIVRSHSASAARQIVVAVDGSPSSQATLREVASRIWAAGTRFRVVTAIDPHLETVMARPGFFADRFVQGTDQSGREWIMRMMEAAGKILSDAGLEVATHIFDSDPKEAILRASEEWPASCVFIGAVGLHHGTRLTLGTVASSVASRAPCSVEIVRPR
jgi:nucleotide-binding universal stress UspA family protein